MRLWEEDETVESSVTGIATILERDLCFIRA